MFEWFSIIVLKNPSMNVFLFEKKYLSDIEKKVVEKSVSMFVIHDFHILLILYFTGIALRRCS